MGGLLSPARNKLLPGGGNRGPVPPDAFGGGGGGGGRGDGDGIHDFHQQLQRYRLGLLVTLASVVMLFITFTTLYAARRGAGRFDPITGSFQSDWVPLLLPIKILLINSAILAVSSVLMEMARRGARMESILFAVGSIPGVQPVREHSLRWVWAAWLAGMAFLYGQLRAWLQLRSYGPQMRHGPASAFFYLLTGTHALHLVVALGVLLYACLAAAQRNSPERRSITLEVTGWYWHFMGAVWLYVLGVLVLIN